LVGAALTTGASSNFIGNVLSTAAITLGASSGVQGSLAAANGVITYGAGATLIPCSATSTGTGGSSGCAQTRTIAAQLGGQTLAPGCYSAVGGAAFGLTGSLTLSGVGQYSFSSPAALTTAAGSAVVLQNGASCSSITWLLGAAVTTGASSAFIGEVRSAAAITLGASSTLRGSVYSTIGTITHGAGATVTPCSGFGVQSVVSHSAPVVQSQPISLPEASFGSSVQTFAALIVIVSATGVAGFMLGKRSNKAKAVDDSVAALRISKSFALETPDPASDMSKLPFGSPLRGRTARGNIPFKATQ